MKAILTRKKFEKKQTLGELILTDNSGKELFKCLTLELPWLNNQKSVSCIPLGIYQSNRRNTERRGKHFHIVPTAPREWILIHSGNYHTDISGCILVGDSYKDINKDGFVDVLNSKITLNKLVKNAPKGFELVIKNK